MFTSLRNGTRTRSAAFTHALGAGLIVTIGLAAQGVASAAESPPVTLPPGFMIPVPSDPVISLPPITIPPTTDPVISVPTITVPPTTDPVITLSADVTIAPNTTETTVPQTTAPTTDPAAMPPPPPAPVVPSAPQSPVAKPGNQAVTVTWSAPASNGGAPIDKYRVERATSAAGPFTNLGPATSPFTNIGLTNGTQYYFRVRAHNAVGWSAPSTVVSATPRTIPTAPQSPKAIPGNQKVTVTWTAPASNGGAAISHYGVQRATNPAGPWTNVTYTNLTTFTNTGLANGTTYYFRVHAYNAAGWGPWSTVVSTAPGTAPSVVPECSVEQGSAFPELLLISWDAPVNNGGAQITDYRISIVRDGTPYKVEAAPGNGGFWFVEVGGSGMYDVYVQAVNKFGYGDVCHDVIYMDLWWLD